MASLMARDDATRGNFPSKKTNTPRRHQEFLSEELGEEQERREVASTRQDARSFRIDVLRNGVRSGGVPRPRESAETTGASG